MREQTHFKKYCSHLKTHSNVHTVTCMPYMYAFVAIVSISGETLKRFSSGWVREWAQPPIHR